MADRPGIGQSVVVGGSVVSGFGGWRWLLGWLFGGFCVVFAWFLTVLGGGLRKKERRWGDKRPKDFGEIKEIEV